MEIINLKTMAKEDLFENTIVALGTFDGCHLAHKAVITSSFIMAKKQGLKSLVYTFKSLPKSHNGENVGCIFTLEERIKAIKSLGVDYLALEDFENVKDLTPTEFFENVLTKGLLAKGASCGYNYRFGKGASADATTLKELFSKNGGGSVQICNKIELNGHHISSTRIRELIKKGEVEELFQYGTHYSVYSPVLFGKHLATKMGLPTINQIIPNGKIVPKTGVYITECEIGEDVYPSITNIGVRPTTDENGEMNMETHIVNYDGLLYGSYIRVNFYKYLRGEKKFDSKEELFEEIERNKQQAIKYFK